jgi:hypothetical protein
VLRYNPSTPYRSSNSLSALSLSENKLEKRKTENSNNNSYDLSTCIVPCLDLSVIRIVSFTVRGGVVTDQFGILGRHLFSVCKSNRKLGKPQFRISHNNFAAIFKNDIDLCS